MLRMDDFKVQSALISAVEAGYDVGGLIPPSL